MAKFVYTPNGYQADECELFGITFKAGEPTEVDATLAMLFRHKPRYRLMFTEVTDEPVVGPFEAAPAKRGRPRKVAQVTDAAPAPEAGTPA